MNEKWFLERLYIFADRARNFAGTVTLCPEEVLLVARKTFLFLIALIKISKLNLLKTSGAFMRKIFHYLVKIVNPILG